MEERLVKDKHIRKLTVQDIQNWKKRKIALLKAQTAATDTKDKIEQIEAEIGFAKLINAKAFVEQINNSLKPEIKQIHQTARIENLKKISRDWKIFKVGIILSWALGILASISISWGAGLLIFLCAIVLTATIILSNWLIDLVLEERQVNLGIAKLLDERLRLAVAESTIEIICSYVKKPQQDTNPELPKEPEKSNPSVTSTEEERKEELLFAFNSLYNNYNNLSTNRHRFQLDNSGSSIPDDNPGLEPS